MSGLLRTFATCFTNFQMLIRSTITPKKTGNSLKSTESTKSVNFSKGLLLTTQCITVELIPCQEARLNFFQEFPMVISDLASPLRTSPGAPH